jgi:tRNASer (uridine44-2'-O)-methyltransferase
MYRDTDFPGFVDIGCGNGLLVHILQSEGYMGWGFDARERKSWAQYKGTSPSSPSGESLQRLLLLPSVVTSGTDDGEGNLSKSDDIHDGIFPEGTFIISNHADELTPWTPILAAISQCPFIMIPCCSHNLTGERYRAPPPKDKSKSPSAFASLVDWVTRIGEDCGWEVETEMLRIPSTRNTGLLGRKRTKEADEVDIPTILQKYGGVEGYYGNVAKLVKSAPRAH